MGWTTTSWGDDNDESEILVSNLRVSLCCDDYHMLGTLEHSDFSSITSGAHETTLRVANEGEPSATGRSLDCTRRYGTNGLGLLIAAK